MGGGGSSTEEELQYFVKDNTFEWVLYVRILRIRIAERVHRVVTYSFRYHRFFRAMKGLDFRTNSVWHWGKSHDK